MSKKLTEEIVWLRGHHSKGARNKEVHNMIKTRSRFNMSAVARSGFNQIGELNS